MSISRTNINLSQFCLEVVGHSYWFGCFGQRASASLYSSKKAQYSACYQWDKSTYTDDYGTRVCDCAGLIKWFLWSNNMSEKAPTYKASEDYGADGFYNKCTSKGKISSLPAEKIGILVFMGSDSSKNHVGVIVDTQGTVVEAKGHDYGVVKSKASSWEYWGKCHLLTYLSSPAPTPTPTNDHYTVDTKPVLPDEKKGYPGEFPVRPSRGYFQRGDTGAEVVKLQKLLEWLIPGCLPKYGCNGDIGTETLTAVKEAQKVLNIKVDGFYGKDTERAAKAYRK